MTEYILAHYDVFKALHVIFVISWMAGMLYLPRLYVYHADAEKGSELSETFKIMERKLLRVIINPAMILTFIFGGLMVAARTDFFHEPWFHIKLTAVILMTVFHMFLARWRKDFVNDKNTRSSKFYRKVNEIPAVLMIIIVFMVILKPF